MLLKHFAWAAGSQTFHLHLLPSLSHLAYLNFPTACRFIDGPPGVILAEQFACKARLVLHFDVNKTIIMTDKAQGSDMNQMLNMLLSECAWGRLEPGPLWVPVGRLATDRLVMLYQGFVGLSRISASSQPESLRQLTETGHVVFK